ncbi:Regulatory protein LuxO [Roseimaritima multifibrata]|uniref:Regulatory protein LuxO n=1 Tax=Roseimaritima multifibrata TaxID=1930274 RepID=A0A517MF96_9BACT|nr:sigma 54-interacting transcriptional regulator [Roseimaritima multifibrata]QDS93516.1 Regulatory protein LuxO [Roseimaritima multifibrata]
MTHPAADFFSTGAVLVSQAMRDVLRIASLAASTDASVLIVGEMGTGKHWLARAIHQASSRRDQPFQRWDCGSIAPLGIGNGEEGLGRSCSPPASGTLFLDHLDRADLPLQDRLSQFVFNAGEQADAHPDSSSTLPAAPCRLIAASSLDLLPPVEEGRFRSDLFWGVNVIPILLPPLRERREDILPLIDHFWKVLNRQIGKQVQSLEGPLLTSLENYPWPGNIDQLFSYLQRVIVCSEGSEPAIDFLPESITGKAKAIAEPVNTADVGSLTTAVVQQGLQTIAEDASDVHSQIVDRVEREVIRQVLLECDGVQTRAASRLGMNRNTLHKKIKDYGMDQPPSAS